MKLQDGEVIDHYRILNRLGAGGMSDVFRATDNNQGREVTLKFPHDEILGDPATFERFQREVKIGQKLDHPHIQKLYNMEGTPLAPYMVLEYVPGTTLRAWLREHLLPHHDAEMGISAAQGLGAQVADALTYAHARGVIHRDMKPENVLVTPDGVAKVMDFGIAFIEGARRITWGSFSSQVGTPDYMAPEQIKGQRGDHRTDVYAVGIMIYEMVAGRTPYDGDNALVIMSQHVTDPPRPPSEFCPDVPPAWDELILKAVRRNAANRWETMAEFLAAIQAPESVDYKALRAERLEQEGEPAGAASVPGLGVTPLKLGLIIGGCFLGLIGIGLLAQLMHHGS